MKLSLLLFGNMLSTTFHAIYAFAPSPRASIPAQSWTPSSWKQAPHPSKMIPSYRDEEELQNVQEKLRSSAPIIFAEEARNLEKELAKACVGEAFVLIGGDCAETFQDTNVNKLWKDFSLFVQLAFLLTFGLERPVVKIGRMCGQYAKPRSHMYETLNDTTLPSFQGDIINSPGFTEEERRPQPSRMMEAYHLSVQSINILRAFIQGGYTDIYNHDSWTNFYTVAKKVESYSGTLARMRQSLRFMSALQISSETNKNLREISFFIGHEALLLPYEECLVRNDSLTQKMYDCSAHFLWIGERTRELNGSHIEFCRGIHNPIGIKISEKMLPEELLEMTYILNPDNIPGRLTLVTRMGSENLNRFLPSFISILKKHDRHVVWVCDPMHANTCTVTENETEFKTRYFKDIWDEIRVFFEIHWKMHSIPGGIHLEMTGQNVTECLGGRSDPIVGFGNYKSAMDPRLNASQTIEITLLLCQLFAIHREVTEMMTRINSKD